ncbi:MAG: hypothetical protein QOI98_1760 [Solirubrobacteraceae bacterium]|jgi:GNAT superfamily N-acetyltransferase|nr:hypothetical protein [Solirubrobacteraceae bacterium]
MAEPLLDGVKTRLGGPRDAAVIAQLVLAGFASWEWAPEWTPSPTDVDESEVAEWLAKPGVWCLLAIHDGRPVGQTTLSPALTDEEPRNEIPGLGHLRHLFVLPDWHGTGLGAFLLDRAVGEARMRGYSRVRLWTPRDNARARAFYEREGWRATGVELVANRFGLPLVQYVRDLG